MRTGIRVSVGALALVGLLWTPAWAKDAPVVVHVGVNGLDKDSGDAIVKALKDMESVEDAKSDGKRIMAQVKAEQTLTLSDIVGVIAAQSTDAKKLEADTAGVELMGTVTVSVANSSDDAKTVEALRSVPNVEKVEGSGGAYELTFKGSAGATIGDLDKALKEKVGAAEGAEPPGVEDVAWTAPKGGDDGGHG